MIAKFIAGAALMVSVASFGAGIAQADCPWMHAQPGVCPVTSPPPPPPPAR